MTKAKNDTRLYQPMTHPRRYWLRMLAVCGLLLGVGIALAARLEEIFFANLVLNGMILGVLLLGMFVIFRQVIMLAPEVSWIEAFRTDRFDLSHGQPSLLGSMATMLSNRHEDEDNPKLVLSPTSKNTLLDSIASRLEERRDTSRYMVSLLIFLGLLGTFWGLLDVVYSVSAAISNLSLNGEDAASIFNGLRDSLTAPLSGMGTAFSSSLFGLAGSLILGFLELQAAQAQNRFYNELEEWLASLTKLTTSSGFASDSDQPIPAYLEALLEQTAESLQALQRSLARGEESRIVANHNVISLTEKLSVLSEQISEQHALNQQMASHYQRLADALATLADGKITLDDSTRSHLRNIETVVTHIARDLQRGHEDMAEQIRGEIRLLTRTLSAQNNATSKTPRGPGQGSV